MARMTGFVFQDKYLKRLEKLSDQEVGRLVRALATYHASGEEPELKGRECGYFDFIRADIDEIELAYQNKCKNMKRGNGEQKTAIDSNCTQLQSIAPDCDQLRTNINININKKEKDINNNDSARAHEEDTPFGAVAVDPLIIKIQQELNGLTDTHYQELDGYRNEMPDDLISYAIDSAVGNGVRNWAYVRAILQGYVRDHVRTVGEAKEKDEKRKQEKKAPQRQGKVVSAQNYTQREYDEKDLEERLGVNDIFRGAS